MTGFSGDIVYIDCNENDTLHGEKLGSIIGFALSSASNNAGGWNARSTFDSYSAGLQQKYGNWESIVRTSYIHRSSEVSKYTLTNRMTELLPRRHPKFDRLISVAADKTLEEIGNKVETPVDLIFRRKERNMNFSEFVVFKVFKLGDSLEIIPCLLEIHGSRVETSLFVLISEEELKIDLRYEERKFTLNSDMIRSIIQDLRNKDYGF